MELTGGRYIDLVPVPPVLEHTEWVDGGPLSFGIEHRVLIGDDDTSTAIARQGPSLHVFDADRAQEYLRFDCFDDTPHYHFINHGLNYAIMFDPAVHGEPVPWTFRCLRSRLAELIAATGADELAARVEQTDLTAIIDDVEQRVSEPVMAPTSDALERARQAQLDWRQKNPDFRDKIVGWYPPADADADAGRTTTADS